MKNFLKVLQGIVAAGAVTLYSQPQAVQVLMPNQQSQTKAAAILALSGAFLPALVGNLGGDKKKTDNITS
jgi:hypothetical protein